jgi:acetyltransferase-like isoleucine patch superfamily enzyme
MLKNVIKNIYYKFKFGKSKVHNFCNIDNFSTLGDYTVLFENVSIINSKINSYSYVQSNSVICNCFIGKFTSIGSSVYIGLASHPISYVSTSPVFYDNKQPLPFFFVKKSTLTEFPKVTTIGNDVWIGNNVLIKEGVNIGSGSIIGAGSIVTKDIEPYSIAFGNPCRHKRYRFDNELISDLLKSEWWNLSDFVLIKYSQYFSNPKEFLNKLNDDIDFLSKKVH